MMMPAPSETGATHARWAAGRLSWLLTPQTLPETVAVGGLVYLVWQPLAHLVVMHWVVRRPLAFGSVWEWTRYALIACAMGCLVGVAYYRVQRMGQGWRRAWAENTLWLTSFHMMMGAAEFRESAFRGVAITLFSSAVTGALCAGVVSLFRKLSRP